MVARRDAFTAARDLSVNLTRDVSVNLTRDLSVNLMPERSLSVAERPAGMEGGYRRERPVFIQYVNPEILACYGKDVVADDAAPVLEQALTATRLAVLLTDSYLLFPSSYIFEVPWFGVLLAHMEPLVRQGLMRHTSPTPELTAYRDRKAREFRQDARNPYASTRPIHVHPDLRWHPRFGDPIAPVIAEQWKKELGPGGELTGLAHTVARAWDRPYERVAHIMAASPKRLEGQAFVRRFVERTLPAPVPSQARNRLAQFLSAAYLRCYLHDLDTAILTDLPLGPLSCGLHGSANGTRGRLLSYRRLDLALRWMRVDGFVHHKASWKELVRLRSRPEFGVIASMLYGSGSADAFRLAVVRAGGSRRFSPAQTCGDALSNVAAVADHLARTAC
ncbi:hypothetical protein DQ384_34660 [Sphaerisporangium album]|uniref:Uncharacterized protein n=1 Tax=Sphaerisporangium album TaxID=509200 RepID=A0A367EZY3_9ACTN|nr:hypothetical protein DQ384_34660 [Sphaerisporangium album]